MLAILIDKDGFLKTMRVSGERQMVFYAEEESPQPYVVENLGPPVHREVRKRVFTRMYARRFPVAIYQEDPGARLNLDGDVFGQILELVKACVSAERPPGGGFLLSAFGSYCNMAEASRPLDDFNGPYMWLNGESTRVVLTAIDQRIQDLRATIRR